MNFQLQQIANLIQNESNRRAEAELVVASSVEDGECERGWGKSSEAVTSRHVATETLLAKFFQEMMTMGFYFIKNLEVQIPPRFCSRRM